MLNHETIGRHSKGDEVGGLEASHQGWKLVRMSSETSGTTSDGKEVVAVWSYAKKSISKSFKFQFLGSGADGGFGERWSIMAVITALQIWDQEQNKNPETTG
jgi:hypothetical protein